MLKERDVTHLMAVVRYGGRAGEKMRESINLWRYKEIPKHK